ncbi:hypothetical protein [Mesobacillus thioparans]|uniref:hypothetical protein n=1 Tax=Mesobacillus thioparans TaxID=370439 RepID=UPI0039F0C84C
MKIIRLSLFIMLLIISGCSQAKQQDEAQENEVKTVKKTETNNTETNEVEKEETPAEEEKSFQHSDYKYTVQLDDRLGEDVVFEEDPETHGVKTNIYFLDQSLLKDKVLIGTIESKSANSREGFMNEGLFTLVNYEDEENNLEYVYSANMEDPYISHYQLNEDGDAYLPLEEATKYFRAMELVHSSLMISNFLNGSIYVNQTVPAQLDSNQKVGLELSREFYDDIQAWYERLNNAVAAGSSEELYSIREQISTEVREKYPELRQIPFPTQEIGYNIPKSIEALSYLSHEQYGTDAEVKYLNEINGVMALGQCVNVIHDQLAELENL